jgi:Tfp pilus assembly protein PilE
MWQLEDTMRITYQQQVKQLGVTLIELILVLFIIVVILVAVINYYETARSAQRVNQGIQLVGMVTTATEHWFATYKSVAGVDIDALNKQGLLPADFNANNPWNSSISISPTEDSTTEIVITINGLNKADCLSLCDLLNKQKVMNKDCNASCTTSSNTYVGTYSPVNNP